MAGARGRSVTCQSHLCRDRADGKDGSEHRNRNSGSAVEKIRKVLLAASTLPSEHLIMSSRRNMKRRFGLGGVWMLVALLAQVAHGQVRDDGNFFSAQAVDE